MHSQYGQSIDTCQYMVRWMARTKVKVPIGVSGTDELCCSSLTAAPLDEPEAVELARVMAALSDPVRLRLLSLVVANTEVCSCDLEAPLGKSQPTVSHHTKVLAQAGLLVGEKRGRWMWWHVEAGRLAAIRKALGG
jgi:ArsR family transcriptional regulator, arsenate/arsenite/antimonite-responsive transcriptional repressor